MSAPEITFDELEKVFWTSGAPEALAGHRANAYQAAFIRRSALPDLINLPDYFYANGWPSYQPIRPETAMFTLTARDFGPATFVAVMSGDWVIVPPFPIDDLDDLPNMRPVKEFP